MSEAGLAGDCGGRSPVRRFCGLVRGFGGAVGWVNGCSEGGALWRGRTAGRGGWLADEVPGRLLVGVVSGRGLGLEGNCELALLNGGLDGSWREEVLGGRRCWSGEFVERPYPKPVFVGDGEALPFSSKSD